MKLALAAVLAALSLTACGTDCGPGTQEYNGTCFANNQVPQDDDDDDFEEDD